MGSTVLIPNERNQPPSAPRNVLSRLTGQRNVRQRAPSLSLFSSRSRADIAPLQNRVAHETNHDTRSTVHCPTPYTQTPTPTNPHSTRGNRPIIGSAQGANNPAESPTGILQAGRSAPVRPGSYHRRCSGLTDRLSQMECPASGPEAGTSGALFNGVSDEVPRVWGGGGAQRDPGRRRRRAA